MTQLLPAAPVFILVLHLLVAAEYGVLFFAGRSPLGRMGTPLLWSTVALHGLYLVLLTLQWHQFPAATVAQAFSVLAFAVALIYALLERWEGERTSGFWMLVQAATFQSLAVILHTPIPPHREVFENPYFGFHALFALLGYASFAVAAGYGFLYLRLYRELKKARFQLFYGKLPPLEVLERMLVGGLTVGLVFLSGGLIIGTIWLIQREPGATLLDPTILVTLFTWALYGGSLLLRRLGRWQGRQTALASLTGLALILGSLVLSRLLLTSFHGGL